MGLSVEKPTFSLSDTIAFSHELRYLFSVLFNRFLCSSIHHRRRSGGFVRAAAGAGCLPPVPDWPERSGPSSPESGKDIAYARAAGRLRSSGWGSRRRGDRTVARRRCASSFPCRNGSTYSAASHSTRPGAGGRPDRRLLADGEHGFVRVEQYAFADRAAGVEPETGSGTVLHFLALHCA